MSGMFFFETHSCFSAHGKIGNFIIIIIIIVVVVVVMVTVRLLVLVQSTNWRDPSVN